MVCGGELLYTILQSGGSGGAASPVRADLRRPEIFDEEWCDMLPCQGTCPDYQCGCHKTCVRWREMQEEQRVQRNAKKEYLRYHSIRCAQTVRQLLSLQTGHPAW